MSATRASHRLAAGCLLFATIAAGTRAATALEPPNQVRRIDQLAWLAGAWIGRDGDVETEEIWIAPKGGAMLCVHRDTRAGRMVGFEFMRIEETADGIVLLSSPQGAPATPFSLVESGDRRVVFANPQHDYPRRILYWLDGGRLHARIEGAAGADPHDWTWQLAADPPRTR